jgi:plastocyanin
MKKVLGLLRSSMHLQCILLSVFIAGSCNTTPKNNAPGDTSATAPKADIGVIAKKPLHGVDTILISDMKFHPEVIKVHQGDSVIWINNDMVTHCVTEAKSKAWTSFQLSAGEVWKMPVSKSADYYCAIHQVMKGKIIME